jgi:hypothetical protein
MTPKVFKKHQPGAPIVKFVQKAKTKKMDEFGLIDADI